MRGLEKIQEPKEFLNCQRLREKGFRVGTSGGLKACSFIAGPEDFPSVQCSGSRPQAFKGLELQGGFRV